jgi:hypothetical protein
MQRIGLLFLTACLAGCGGPVSDGPGPQQGGRYAGIGLYGAGDMWQRLVAASRPQDAAAASLRDDEMVIVVVDSRTGEVRQCGNLSGHCIGSNPWAAPLGREQTLPVNLTETRAAVDRARDQQGGAVVNDMNAATETTNSAQPGRR